MQYLSSILQKLSASDTAWKVSKYGVFSGPYFPVFGLNTERYGVSLHIQSEWENMDQKILRIWTLMQWRVCARVNYQIGLWRKCQVNTRWWSIWYVCRFFNYLLQTKFCCYIFDYISFETGFVMTIPIFWFSIKSPINRIRNGLSWHKLQVFNEFFKFVLSLACESV